MKLKVVAFLILSSVIVSCMSEKDKALKQILSIENELSADTLSSIDKTQAMKLVQLYLGFAKDFPDDSQAPQYLFKAGELSMNLNLGQQAIQYFTNMLNNYPECDKRPEAIFLQAFIYENQLQDYDRAKKLYKDFINQYPSHELYDDAKASLKNIGRPLEDIIKEFESKALNDTIVKPE